MTLPNATPEKIKSAEERLNELRASRDQQVVELRKSNPKYWSLARLAKHWGRSRQTIRTILINAGIDTSDTGEE